MFDSIKCYKRLKRLEKRVQNDKKISEIKRNDEIVKEDDKLLKLIAYLKKRIFIYPDIANEVNLMFEAKDSK